MAYVKKLSEGKTKIIWEVEDEKYVEIQSKDDLTAGNGKKKSGFGGKGVISNKTTCNVFEFLADCGVKTHYVEQVNDDSFRAIRCKMIPLEVIARRKADGSYLERHPDVEKGAISPRLKAEFFWKNDAGHDPLIRISKENKHPYYPNSYYPDIPPDKREYCHLYYAHQPHQFIKTIDSVCSLENFQQMENLVRFTFLLLEKAWKNLGVDLWDLKLEFGYNAENYKLLLADVIDNDSWRITKDGVQLDKQIFRDGNTPMDEIARRYELVKNLTFHFREMVNRKNNVYYPEIVALYGSDKSEKDKKFVYKIKDNLLRYNWTNYKSIQASAHKETLKLLKIISEESHKNFNPIFICVAGLQNELAPVVAAHTTAPVISCSPTVENFPNDIWSNVRLPNGVSAGFVWTPEQAALQALKIISQVNPLVYAKLQTEVEDRFDT